MGLLTVDTIFKRQLRTLLNSTLFLGFINLFMFLFAIIMFKIKHESYESSWFCKNIYLIWFVFLYIQMFISGVLLGGEEEDNKTCNFVLRLPLSKGHWVWERFKSVIAAFLILLGFLSINHIIIHKITGFGVGLHKMFLPGLNIIFILVSSMLFWVPLAVSSWVKKVIPSCLISLFILFLIYLITVSLIKDNRYVYEYPNQIVNLIVSTIVICISLISYFGAIKIKEGR